jgi:hypothetical protein
MTNSEEGLRTFPSNNYGGQVTASRIELKDPNRKLGTVGWLTRFTLITAGQTAEKWPTINACYVNGIIDDDGNWIANFPEPTAENPTTF